MGERIIFSTNSAETTEWPHTKEQSRTLISYVSEKLTENISKAMLRLTDLFISQDSIIFIGG